MLIQVDSREKRNDHILSYFDKKGIEHFPSKLYVGDYVNFDNPRIVVERKKNVLEFAGNVGKHHDRFKRELMRLDEIGGTMHILIEEPIELMELDNWYDKKSKMDGRVIRKIIQSWREKHSLEVHFCSKSDSGKIIELLLGGNHDQ